MRAVNLIVPPASNIFTSYVYCQKKGEKAPRVVSGAGLTPGVNLGVGIADTAACSGKRDAFAGGFQVPPFVGAPVLPIVIESRHAGEGWHVAAQRLSGTGPAQASIAAYGYCS
jgi:hypothetical protein